MKTYSTRQAARQLGISFPTLNRYIGADKVPVPHVTEIATARVRLWTTSDIERVRKILPKIANGRKTRYQKKKQSALSSQHSAKTKDKKHAKASKRTPASHATRRRSRSLAKNASG